MHSLYNIIFTCARKYIRENVEAFRRSNQILRKDILVFAIPPFYCYRDTQTSSASCFVPVFSDCRSIIAKWNTWFKKLIDKITRKLLLLHVIFNFSQFLRENLIFLRSNHDTCIVFKFRTLEKFRNCDLKYSEIYNIDLFTLYFCWKQI